VQQRRVRKEEKETVKFAALQNGSVARREKRAFPGRERPSRAVPRGAAMRYNAFTHACATTYFRKTHDLTICELSATTAAACARVTRNRQGKQKS